MEKEQLINEIIYDLNECNTLSFMKEIKEGENIIFEVLKKEPKIFKQFPDKIRNRKKISFKAVMINPFNIQYTVYKKNKAFMISLFESGKENNYSSKFYSVLLNMMNREIKKDDEFMEKLCLIEKLSFCFSSQDIKNNCEFFILIHNRKDLENQSLTYLDLIKTDIFQEIVETGSFGMFPESILKDEDFIYHFYEKYGNDIMKTKTFIDTFHDENFFIKSYVSKNNLSKEIHTESTKIFKL